MQPTLGVAPALGWVKGWLDARGGWRLSRRVVVWQGLPLLRNTTHASLKCVAAPQVAGQQAWPVQTGGSTEGTSEQRHSALAQGRPRTTAAGARASTSVIVGSL